jgi:hypothetical protein
VRAVLPEGGLSEFMLVEGSAIEVYRAEFMIHAATGLMTLIGLALVCLAVTTWNVRRREFTTPVATTE